MDYEISVENIKCGGCASSIRKRLAGFDGVRDVQVDIEAGIVGISGDPAQRDILVRELGALGYPETGSVEGLKAAAAKAKSFVSCAVGRLDDSAAD